MKYDNLPYRGFVLSLAILTATFGLTLPSDANALNAQTPSQDSFQNPFQNIAFFYGAELPKALGIYDVIVIDPRVATTHSWQAIGADTKVVCYLSVGETEATDSSQWIVGSNPAWRTNVMDVTAPDWHEELITKAKRYLAQGCQGLFLDTLDSYQLGFETDQWPLAEQGLATFINALADAAPEASIILNRGFEVFEQVKQHIAAVALEGLFQRWDEKTRKIYPLAKPEREALLARIAPIQRAGLPVIVIDYFAASTSNEKRAEHAAHLRDQGFIPWVTDPTLRQLGVSHEIHVPREILILHDGNSGAYHSSDAHLLYGAILDFMGLTAKPWDLTKGLPRTVAGHHAGVLMHANGSQFNRLPITPDAWSQWVVRQVKLGIPALYAGALPPLNEQAQAALGISFAQAVASSRPMPVITTTLPIPPFEAPLPSHRQVSQPVFNRSEDNEVWLAHAATLTSTQSEGDLAAANVGIMTGSWGGFALHPNLLQAGFGGKRRWLLDPFALLSNVFGKSDMPMPDTTTENGSRIWLNHLDGDGFPSRAEIPGTPFSAQVWQQEILEKYDLPHTVSIIEGEIASHGLYPELAPSLEAVARKIFVHPRVEIASHSFSHPFFWQEETLSDGRATPYGRWLPIPGYTLDLSREILGSTNYINTKLSPAGKQVKVMLWTGDALPSSTAVALTKQANLRNLNGGSTSIRNAEPSLTNVYPQARYTDNGYQVYAPITNENIYTNNWTGPFHGFRHVIETFERTGKPRRLKPLSIYYHFFSATKQAGINALHDIYDYALAQQTTPMYASAYADRVTSYHDVVVTKPAENQWSLHNLGALRTVRLNSTQRWPDLGKSRNVAGFSDNNGARYVHLSGTDAHLVLTDKPPITPYLVSANGLLKYWRKESEQIDLQVTGHRPIRLEIAGTSSSKCTLHANGEEYAGRAGQQTTTFNITSEDTGNARLVCR